MIWFCALAFRMIVSMARPDLVGSELAALEQVGPPDDRGQRRPQLVRQRGQELVLHPARRLGHRARLLRLAVEVRVVDGNGRVGREAGDQAFVARMEGPRVRMSEEETAQQVAGAGANRRREIAPCGQDAGRHLLEREVLTKARVAGEVVAARDGALEGRSEGFGILGQGEVDEGLRRRARDTVGPDAGRVPVQEGPERGARDRDASVGDRLDQPFQVEVARQRQPQPVEGRDLRLKLLSGRRHALALGRVARGSHRARPAWSRAARSWRQGDQAACDEEEAEAEGVPCMNGRQREPGRHEEGGAGDCRQQRGRQPRPGPPNQAATITAPRSSRDALFASTKGARASATAAARTKARRPIA